LSILKVSTFFNPTSSPSESSAYALLPPRSDTQDSTSKNVRLCYLQEFILPFDIYYPYHLLDDPIKRIYQRIFCIFIFKDLVGSSFTIPRLFMFRALCHHINETISKGLQILGFIKRVGVSKTFSPENCLRSLYFSLVRSKLEYGI